MIEFFDSVLFYPIVVILWLCVIYLTARVWYKGKESETKSTYRRLVKGAFKLGSIAEKAKKIKKEMEDKKQ